MSFLKDLGSSVSILWLLGAAALLGLLLLIPRRTRRLARYWLLTITGTYAVLGVPAVANAIAGRLPAATRLHEDADPIGALIVFDGDNRRGRLAVALDTWAARRPGQVWVLSDEWLADELEAAGHPRQSFGHDTTTTNTREQMDWVARFVESNPRTPVTVVASRLQAPRVAALADSRGLPLTILPSPIDTEPPASGWRRWVPSYVGLRTSRDAIYEHAALWYYRQRNWIER
jgi:uncharacterized SAM-binding protein YcdF (DUF218 family)